MLTVTRRSVATKGISLPVPPFPAPAPRRAVQAVGVKGGVSPVAPKGWPQARVDADRSPADPARRRGATQQPWVPDSPREDRLPFVLRRTVGVLWLLGVILFFAAAVLADWSWLAGVIVLVLLGMFALLRDPGWRR